MAGFETSDLNRTLLFDECFEADLIDGEIARKFAIRKLCEAAEPVAFGILSS